MVESNKTPTCDECGAPMIRAVRPSTWIYKRRAITYDQPGWWCPNDPAHDAVLDQADSDATTPILLEHRAVVEGGLPPREVRRIRQRLGLSQREAGRVVGGGPLAFHKYEKGEVATTQAMGNFLLLLDRHPELVAELRQNRSRRAA